VNELSFAIFSHFRNLTELFVTDARKLGFPFANHFTIFGLPKLRKLFIRSPKRSSSVIGTFPFCQMPNLVEMDLHWGDFGENGK
jgi:hypothetical protein